MSNSPLVTYTRISPNQSSRLGNKITTITIHHMAGILDVETVGRIFSDGYREASSNYAIDNNLEVGMYVEEKDRSWASSNGDNDRKAVTIELANDEVGGDWHVSDAVIDTIQLPASAWTKDKMLFVKIRYLGITSSSIFLGSDSILSNQYIKAGSTADNNTFLKAAYFIDGSIRWVVAKTSSSANKLQGVTAGPLSSNGLLSLKAMAGSGIGLINGRYKVDVYELDWPDDSSPYNEYSA